MNWIFLRGLTRETRHWGSFAETFRATVPGAQVTAIDLPGCGRHYLEESPGRIEAIVEHCRDQAAALERRGPCHLLAMSLGAMVAVDWVTRYPGEVRAGVLVNTSLRPFSPFHHRLKPHSYLPLLRMVLLEPDARTRESLVLRLTSSAKANDRATLDAWIEYRREAPVSRRNALRQLVAAAGYRASLRKPPVPLLVLASAGDGLVDPRCSAALAKQWRLPLISHPAAGHDLPLDDGPWVASQVRRWIETLA